uniref:Uncharacterized protein n=1 Tax=Arundo donax TaxID=35708 RepID=A0A0A9EG76_ARUDO
MKLQWSSSQLVCIAKTNRASTLQGTNLGWGTKFFETISAPWVPTLPLVVSTNTDRCRALMKKMNVIEFGLD